jgi:hypothetical protein
MCDVCIPILKNCGSRHERSECVVANSFYCSICAKYGHSYDDCPQTDIKKSRQTTGQVNLNNIVIDFGFPDDYESWVEVVDDEDGKSVRAMLIANSIVPMTCQEKGRSEKRDVVENTTRLREFLKKQGKKLVLVEPYEKTRVRITKKDNSTCNFCFRAPSSSSA